MLQQTGTGRVAERYEDFLRKFPDVQRLAKAPLTSVLRAWQGLGYNRRALSLSCAAKIIQGEYSGRVPRTREELLKLPGIGPATASAVLVFSHNEPHAFIETNIRRVFLHFYFPNATGVADSEILRLVEATMDRKRPREWFYALMDYGAALKSRLPNPNKRSAAYRPQAPFEGSPRQLRGRVLRILLGKHSATVATLARACGSDVKTLRPVLGALAREGFLLRRGARIYVR